MVKMTSLIMRLLLIVYCLAPWASYSKESNLLQAGKYEMGFGCSGPGETECMYSVGKERFKSLDALKEFITQMPKSSTLVWNPGCLRLWNEPLLSSEKDMADFKDFCEKHDINFVLVPSG